MNRLFDLPPELFSLIFTKFIEGAELHEIFRARAVCRVFATKLNHELLANTPATTYEDYRRSVSPSLASYEDYCRTTSPSLASSKGAGSFYSFLEVNAGTMLYNHALSNQGVQPRLPAFINKVADNLMRFVQALPEDRTAIRETYLRDLSTASAALKNSTVSSLLMPGPEPDTKVMVIMGITLDREESAYLRLEQTQTDAMAAAAAVGNILAIQHFATRGGWALGRTYNNGGFNNPIQAAASTGKTEALIVLLDFAEKELNSEKFTVLLGYNSKDLFSILDAAIGLAVKAHHARAALILRDFVQKHCQQEFERGKETLLIRAIQSGCLELVEAILEDPKHVVSDSAEDIKHGAREALISGHTDVVRYLLANEILHPKAILRDKDARGDRDTKEGPPMALAAFGRHRAIVNLLIEYGVQVKAVHLVNALAKYTRDFSTRPAFLIVRHLIDKGAIVDRSVLAVLESGASNFMRSRYDRKRHACITNGAMTITLIANEAKKHLTSEDMQLQMNGTIKLVLKLITTGKIEVPTEPMPFQSMAKEVYEWLASGKDAA